MVEEISLVYRIRNVVLMMPLLIVCLYPVTALAKTHIDPSSSGPWLVFDFSLGFGMGSPGTERPGGVRFEVQIAENNTRERVFRAKYDKLQWYPYAINLSEYAGKEIRVRFLVEHIEGRIMMDYPHWGNPRIVLGSLVGKQLPEEIFNFAMSPINKVGCILVDGTEVELLEKDPVFPQPGSTLVTPGLLNREHMLLVYAGDTYICVPGKAQPGIYMGVSMSVDSLRIGADPNQTPYTGKMPPPVFAEWTVKVPGLPGREKEPSPAPPYEKTQVAPPSGFFQGITFREDTYAYKPGLKAKYKAETLTMEANMGPAADLGWAFVGVETMGLSYIPLAIEATGKFTPRDENSFAGLIVDYHTKRGYQKRVFFGLGAGSSDRYDLRPGDWILDEASLSREQRFTFQYQFVDMKDVLKRGRARLNLEISRYAPLAWDGRIWLGVGVQNVDKNAGLKVQIENMKPSQSNPPIVDLFKQKKEFVVLEDRQLRVAISKINGVLCGAWDKDSGRRIMIESPDNYRVERRWDIAESSEEFHKVVSLKPVSADGVFGVIIVCKDPALPDLVIEKHYQVEPGGILSKRVAFTTSDTEGFFVHYTTATNLNEKFLVESKRGGGLEKKTVVAQGKVVELTDEVALEQSSIADAPMVIARDFSLGVAGYRYRVNDRFVLRSSAGGTPQGWRSKVFVDYLKAGQEVSGEYRWFVFPGDFTVFERHYQNILGYRDLWNYSRQKWVSRIVCDVMYYTDNQEVFFNALEPYLATTTFWFLNSPWGNWGAFHDNPNKRHPGIFGATTAVRRTIPNARLSVYHNFFFDKTSDVYRDHPDYGVRDREGQFVVTGINSDSSRGPSFFFQINNPEVRKCLLDMHAERMKEWKLDFLYLDGSPSCEKPDWGFLDVIQSYDVLDYLKALRRRLKEANPDAAIFGNGELPYSDIGYIENRNEHWQTLLGTDWQSEAMKLFRAKINEPEEYVYVPTYGTHEADPGLASYVMMYGWCGHLRGLHSRIPWMMAAWELRGIQIVEDAVEPRWWRSGGNVEAYGFRKGELGVVNILNHATEFEKVKVRVDTKKLGLHIGEPLFAWFFEMNDPRIVKDVDVENPGEGLQVYVLWNEGGYSREQPVSPGQVLTPEQKKTRKVFRSRAVSPGILFTGKLCPGQLDIKVPTSPGLLTTVVLSHTPAILESVNGKKTQIGLIEHLDVRVTGRQEEKVINLKIDCKVDSAGVIVPGVTLAKADITTSSPVEDATWAGQPALRITVNEGVHAIKIERKK